MTTTVGTATAEILTTAVIGHDTTTTIVIASGNDHAKVGLVGAIAIVTIFGNGDIAVGTKSVTDHCLRIGQALMT